MTERVTVLVCDDHPIFRTALADVVKARPDLQLVAEAANGRDALDRIRELSPDVAVLDLKMGDGLSGEQVLGAVVREQMPTRVLILSASDEPREVYDLLAAGARGYLEKGASPEEVARAIVAIARGDHVISPRLQDAVVGQIHARGAAAARPLLSTREQEILRHVADGLSAPEIARTLHLSVSTIKTHQQNVYEKLGVSDRAAAVAEAMRRGLLE